MGFADDMNKSLDELRDIAAKAIAQRDELAEALRYWIPDEVMVGDEYWNAWNRHMAVLAKLK